MPWRALSFVCHSLPVTVSALGDMPQNGCFLSQFANSVAPMAVVFPLS